MSEIETLTPMQVKAGDAAWKAATEAGKTPKERRMAVYAAIRLYRPLSEGPGA